MASNRPSTSRGQLEICAPRSCVRRSKCSGCQPAATRSRGECWSRFCLFPEDGYPVCGADWYLAHISPFFGPVVFLDDIGACYRVHGSNQYTSERLDLKQIRQSIVFMRTTLTYIEQTALRMGLLGGVHGPDQILSFSYIAQRMISVTLEPRLHPLPGERRWPLVRLGVAALARRFDVTVGLKLAMLAWLVCMAIAPRRVAWYVAEQFMVPERRPAWVTSSVALAHRRHAESRRSPGGGAVQRGQLSLARAGHNMCAPRDVR